LTGQSEQGAEIEYKIEIFLDQPYAEIELYGIYFLEGVQRAKVQTNVFHNAPHTKSRINVKGALRGAASHFYWTGDVFIASNATDSDTYEENRNLILNPGPQVTSIPNLEILTGDIRGAGHASATGRFDDEQLFYLTSRGIDPESAKNMVLSGFLNSQIELIDDAQITQQFQELINE
jgi:Fe-S cluster assembly protein SufD